jgi:hypothetical protein
VISGLRLEQDRGGHHSLLFSDGTKKSIAAGQPIVYHWNGGIVDEYGLKASLSDCDSIIAAFPHLGGQGMGIEKGSKR